MIIDFFQTPPVPWERVFGAECATLDFHSRKALTESISMSPILLV
jgi:hypothetical protein